MRTRAHRLQEIYLDETFIWRNTQRQWSWFPDDDDHAAIATKASKGDRWTVIHAGGIDGWVDQAMFLRKVDRRGDFHGTITADHFAEWFRDWLLPGLKKPSLIIMDNASFHRKKATTLAKLDMDALRARLRKHRIDFDDDSSRDDLLTLVKERCELRPSVERVARQAGHQVLWLPPYHPELNPIERMWGVAKNSTRAAFTIDPVNEEAFLARLDEAFLKCDASVWSGSVEKSWQIAKSLVNIEQMYVDAAVADAQPAPVYSDDEDDKSDEKSEMVAGRAIDRHSDSKRSPRAAADASARSAAQAELPHATPSRRSGRKRAPSRKKAEAADDSDERPRTRARKGSVKASS